MNRRGLSGIVTAVIMIALVIGAAAVVWAIVSNMVTDRLEGSASCSGVFDKVTLNNRYTCYDEPEMELSFSLTQEAIEVDKIIVSVLGEGTTKSFDIPAIDDLNLREYPSGIYGSGTLGLPGSNSGESYILDWSRMMGPDAGWPDEIQIRPVIDGKQCEVSDRILEIESCIDLLA